MIKILSCNIRTSRAEDGENGWAFRRELCRDVIRGRDGDVIGFQEMTPEQMSYLNAEFPEHDAYWILDRPTDGEPVNAVFYRREAFTLQSAGGYWLSEKPHVPGSRSWKSDCIRLANWVLLAEKRSGRRFRLINTHLDHVSQRARENQSALIIEDAAAYDASFAQILTGDMNAGRGNPAIQAFKKAGWRDALETVFGDRELGRTAHEFLGAEACEGAEGRIDWIFTRGEARVMSAEIIRDSAGGRHPSDHYFLAAQIDLP